MRLLFVTHRTHVPDATGGAQRSMHALLARVAARHGCEVVCAYADGARQLAFRAWRRAAGRRPRGWRDVRAGYTAYRAPGFLVPALADERIAAARPDVVVVDFGDVALLDAIRRHRVPTLVRIVDAIFQREDLAFEDGLTAAFANSTFVADRLRALGARPAGVVYPIVDALEYRVARTRASAVTFINPRPLKGLDLAIGIARRLPHRPFLFVESWPLTRAAFRAVAARVAGLPNVTLVRARGDVRTVYRRTRLLIVPSLCEEAFGRVVLEAQASGIPVIARAAGGLPEAVGAGGVVLPPDAGAEAWSDAVEAAAARDERYEALSCAARANSARPEFSPDVIARRFLSLAEAHASCTA